MNPTGTVTFQLDGSAISTAPVNSSGVAVYSISSVSWLSGFHTITAVYSGDANNAVASVAVPETVNLAPPPGSSITLTPASGPPGQVFTITGSGFGQTQGTSTVTFGGTSVTVCSTCWSATTITNLNVPATLAAGSYPVAVNVNGTVVGQAPFLVIPQITLLSLPQGPPTMGLVITGTGFGTTQGTVTFQTGNTQAQATVLPGTWGAAANNQQTIVVQVPSGIAVADGSPGTLVDIYVTVPYGLSNPSATASSLPPIHPIHSNKSIRLQLIVNPS